MASSELQPNDGSAPQIRDKTVEWYSEHIAIPAPARILLEQYSGIALEDVESHVHRVRDQAWQIAPYPCLGCGRFLQLGLSQRPSYPEILHRVQSGQTLLDVGCCLGQDLRKLIFDGAPVDKVFGTELNAELVEAGFEMFRDREKMEDRMIVCNFMEEGNALDKLKGEIDVIYAGSFLHLFDWDGQVRAVKRMVQLLKPEKDSLVVGRQVGALVAGPHFKDKVAGANMYCHNVKSFQKMWDVVGGETGTKWKVEGELESFGRSGFDPTGKFGGPDGVRLTFAVRRE